MLLEIHLVYKIAPMILACYWYVLQQLILLQGPILLTWINFNPGMDR